MPGFRSKLLKRANFALVVLVILLSLIVLVVWLYGDTQSGFAALTQVPMAPLTASLFLLVGIVQLILHFDNPSANLRSLLRIIIVITGLTSAYLIVRAFFSADSVFYFDFERLFVSEVVSQTGFVIGRTSPITAMLFFIVSSYLFLSTLRCGSKRLRVLLGDCMALIVLVSAFVIVVGYIFQSPLFYGGTLIPVALVTAICFLLVSTGQLFNSSENMLSRFASSTSVSAQISRAIVPISVVLIILLSWLAQFASERNGDINQTIFSTIGAISISALITLIVYLSATRIQQGIDHNITERKKAEDKLSQQNALLNAMINSPSDIIIFALDKDFRYTAFNENHRREMLKVWKIDIKIGMSMADAITIPEIRAIAFHSYQRVLDGDVFTEIQEQPNMGIYYEFNWSPIRANNGKAIGITAFIRDITERKLAEAKVVELESLKIINLAKDDLLANVSHELRTPLTSIKGSIESLLETDVKWSKEQQLEFLMVANRQADHLTFLIKDLLDMSRIDAGKLTLDKRSYPVKEILDSASGVLSIIAAKHKLKIANLSDLPPIQADKARMAQVITNLVKNASKFSPEGSPIEIAANLNEGIVIISVEDHGIGMPPEVVARLFDRFYQSYRVVEGKTHGTGLGLSICKSIVEAHGGQIWAESQVGKGSKFSFSIPV